jgi:hypothetical protein
MVIIHSLRKAKGTAMLLRRLTQHLKEQNWFAVALDFLIVVIGVGFALMAEQWISDGQKRADLIEAESNLQDDLLRTYFAAKERIALADCRISNLRDLGERLLEPGETWEPIHRSDSDKDSKLAFPQVLRSPSRSWGSRIWEAELGRGTFNALGAERRGLLGDAFTLGDGVSILQDAIINAQARLKALGQVTEISRADRLRYFDIVAGIDQNSFFLERAASQIVTIIETIGFDYDEDELSELREQLTAANNSSSAAYGECRKPPVYPFLEVTTAPANTP